MAIFPLRTFGDPVLRTVTSPVREIDAGVKKLAADLIETMHDAPGVGLAANQIGVSRAVAVFDAQDGEGARV
ncbi:MAG: peptide deformylase, partial [Acidimicrobiia bacterium]|nr:peptide deformylase [Acidimicrobiia bacterium]